MAIVLTLRVTISGVMSNELQVAPVLVTWLHSVDRASVPHLLDTILSARDFALPDVRFMWMRGSMALSHTD